ncbi:MAG: hypothetical protein FWD28_01800 [Treponema sp.]|nr:hypothetical protein [Treponema sp.]
MKKIILLFTCSFIFTLFSCYKTNYSSTEWIKQNSEYEEGTFTLIIDEKLQFSIEIYSHVYDGIYGKVEGKLNKINSRSKPSVNYYYIIFKDHSGIYDSRKEDSIMIFTEINDQIFVSVFGDDVNTNGFSYQGLYIKNEPLNIEEEEKLNSIFSNYYDMKIIKNMLGLNIRYFLEIFEQIKIENEYIYILLGDTRNNQWDYKYFTNNITGEIPIEILEWRLFPESDDIKITEIIR